MKYFFYKKTLLPQTDGATRYVSQNLVNCRNKLFNRSTTNRTELEGYSWATCSKQPRLVDCRIGVVNKLDRRRRRRCQQRWQVDDNAIDLLRRNFLCPKFGADFQSPGYEWMNEHFIYQHRYNTVKTIKSRTVSTGPKGSKSTYNYPIKIRKSWM